MAADPRLLALPALQVEAERLAIEMHRAGDMLWADTCAETRSILVRRQSRLLADMTRPQSRDWAVRVLVERDRDGLPPDSGSWYRYYDSLRDKPEALTLALLEVLDSR